MNTGSTRLCVWVLLSALVGVASCTSSTAHTAVVSSPDLGSASPAPTSLPPTVPSGTLPRSGTVPESGAQPADTTGPETTVAATEAAFGVADFAAVGVGVYADAGQQEPLLAVSTSLPATPIRLLQTQLKAGLLEVADGQGVLGSSLDAGIPTDPGLAPPSFLIAGWVSGSGSPGALLAHRMMGDHDWTQAPSLLFPGLVLSLYSADAARFADALAGPGTALPTDASESVTPDQPASRVGAPGPRGVTGSAGLSRPLTVGVCAQVKGFVDSMVASMFDALGHLSSPQVPSAGNVALDFFGAGIQTGLNLAVGVVNGLIDAGRFLVVNGIKLAVQPILDQVARVASALGVVALITNLLRPWTIRMVADPASTRKAVGSEPGLAGTVGATVDLGGFDEWPAEIIGCAETAGVTLPSLKPLGAPITWKFDQSPGDLAVEDPGKATVLDAKAHAELAYTTTQEDEETAKGDVRTGTMSFHVSIRRKEIADFQQTIGNLLFAQVPSLIAPILSALLRPTLDSVLAALPSFFDSTAQIPVPVVYHESTTTTTSTPPIATGLAIDPCLLVTEQQAGGALGYDPGPGVGGGPNGQQCEYGTGTPGALTISVFTGPPRGGQGPFQQAEANAQNLTGKGFSGIAGGIGDGAFAVLLGPGAVVTFYIGDTTVVVFLRFKDPHTLNPGSQAEGLAAAAATALAQGSPQP